jgi:hypothetical protein
VDLTVSLDRSGHVADRFPQKQDGTAATTRDSNAGKRLAIGLRVAVQFLP